MGLDNKLILLQALMGIKRGSIVLIDNKAVYDRRPEHGKAWAEFETPEQAGAFLDGCIKGVESQLPSTLLSARRRRYEKITASLAV